MVKFYSLDSDEEELAVANVVESEDAFAAQTPDVSAGIRMTPKIPPAFDGTTSWFEFEDLIDDWLGITTLTAEKHGPSLKNTLHGQASFYKHMLNNETLRDPDLGVAHFKDVLRPFFVKGIDHVFLFRFLQLFRMYRGSSCSGSVASRSL